MTNRIALYIGADFHCGSSVGLLRTGTKLLDPDAKPYEPELTVTQHYLEEIYDKSISAFTEFAADWPCAVVILGDATQGNKHPTMLVSDRLADQPLIAMQALEPLYALPGLSCVKIIAGTEAHNYGQASSEIMICELARRQFPQVETSLSYHPLVRFAGLLADLAHHGPSIGARSWLAGNNVRYYLRDLITREILSNRIPPRLVLRAHVHADRYEYLEVGEHRAEMYVLPSMCGMGDYAVKVTRSAESIVNGFLFLAIEDGRIVKARRDYHRLDLRTVETI